MNKNIVFVDQTLTDQCSNYIFFISRFSVSFSFLMWAETQCISLQKKAFFEFQIHLIQFFFLNFVLVESVLTAFKEFEISFNFCLNQKNKTRVPHYKKGKSIFIMFVSLQFSLQILFSDKSFVCRTF
jgi:hypothetical protein